MPRRIILLTTAILCLLFGLATVAPAHAQENSGETVVHEVSWGENLSRIASRYGTEVDAIMAANGLSSPDRIRVGQQLVIPSGQTLPGPAGPPVSHVVQPGENLFRIGLLYGLTTDALAQANRIEPSSRLYAGQVLQVPAAGAAMSLGDAATPSSPGTYVVARGETLFGIAQKHGVSVEALSAANGLYNPGQLYAGQVLSIPGEAGTSAAGYSPAQAATTHIVARGDTLTALSRRYGVSVGLLMQVNNLGNPSLLHAGQTLTIPASDALSAAGDGGAAGKRIHVDLSEQRAYVYQGGQLMWTFVVSTGLPGVDTWTGNFHVQNKLPMAYAATWDLKMPNWLGIYWAGSLQNGFHALPILSNGQRLWADVLGRPASYGCIILSVEDAEQLYAWAEVGTEVTIVP